MKKNYFYNLLITIFNLLFPILSFPYAAHILGPSGIGKIQFIITFAQYFALIAALGLPLYGIREIAKVKGNNNQLSKTFSELMIIAIITSIVLTVIFLIMIFVVDKFTIDAKYYIVSSLIVLFSFSSIDWFYQGLELFNIIAYRSIAIKICSLIFLYTSVKTKNDLFIYLLITIFSILGNNVINILFVHKEVKIKFSDIDLSKHIKPLIYIFGSTLSMAMYAMFDTILLGLLSNDQSVGYYTAGVKLSKISIPFVTAIGGALLPQISLAFINDKKKFNELVLFSFELTVILSIPISVGLLLLAPELVTVFSGKEFLKAIMPMRLMSFLPFLIGMGNLLGIQILMTAGKEKEILKSVIIGMIISVIGNIILVPYYKENGAAITNLFTELVVSLLFLYFVKKNFKIDLKLDTIVKSIFFSLFFIPMIFFIRSTTHNNTLIIIYSLLTCGITYLVFQLFFLKNKFVLNHFFKNVH